MRNIYNKLSIKSIIFFTMIIMILTNAVMYLFFGAYTNVIRVDGKGYYVYLPAIFVYGNDLSFHFLEDTSEFLVNGVNRYPIGVAICWLPFWLVGRLIYSILKVNDTGYGLIYELLILFSGFFYWAVGIICTYKILIKKFKKETALISCLIITYGTRLFHYSTVDACLSHTYSFAFISLLGVTFIKFVETKKKWLALLCGCELGVITAIRNVNIIVALVPIAYLLTEQVKTNKMKNFFILGMHFLIAGIGTGIGFLPMIFYWYMVTGKLIYNSYGQWSFDWFHPAFIQVLWGEDSISGMIKLSPILILVIWGAIMMLKSYRNKIVPVTMIALLLLDFYIVSCCWAPAGLGRRNYVNMLSVIAFLISYPIEKFIVEKKGSCVVNRGIIIFVILSTIWNVIEMVYYQLYW